MNQEFNFLMFKAALAIGAGKPRFIISRYSRQRGSDVTLNLDISSYNVECFSSDSGHALEEAFLVLGHLISNYLAEPDNYFGKESDYSKAETNER